MLCRQNRRPRGKAGARGQPQPRRRHNRRRSRRHNRRPGRRHSQGHCRATGATARHPRSVRVQRRRRGAPPRRPPDEGHRDRPAAPGGAGLRTGHVRRARLGRRRLGRLRRRRRGGRHGRRARGLVRRHRPLQAAARPAHPAHGDHPDEEGPVRRHPRRVRRRELPLLRGGPYLSLIHIAASAPGWPSPRTPTVSRPNWPPPCAAR